MGASATTLLIDESVVQFAEHLAAASAAPGGGSAAALAGALAASLTGMVGRLTAGRPKFAAVDAAMRAIAAQADAQRSALLALVDADAAAFEAVMAALRLPKETAEQKAARNSAIQTAYRSAIAVPLHTLTAAVDLLRLLVIVTESGNPNAITDGGVGALLAEAAAQGAALNVRINLAAVQDADFCAAAAAQVDQLLTAATHLRGQALAQVQQRLAV